MVIDCVQISIGRILSQPNPPEYSKEKEKNSVHFVTIEYFTERVMLIKTNKVFFLQSLNVCSQIVLMYFCSGRIFSKSLKHLSSKMYWTGLTL
jgi:hypothetical protein